MLSATNHSRHHESIRQSLSDFLLQSRSQVRGQQLVLVTFVGLRRAFQNHHDLRAAHERRLLRDHCSRQQSEAIVGSLGQFLLHGAGAIGSQQLIGESVRRFSDSFQ